MALIDPRIQNESYELRTVQIVDECGRVVWSREIEVAPVVPAGQLLTAVHANFEFTVENPTAQPERRWKRVMDWRG